MIFLLASLLVRDCWRSRVVSLPFARPCDGGPNSKRRVKERLRKAVKYGTELGTKSISQAGLKHYFHQGNFLNLISFSPSIAGYNWSTITKLQKFLTSWRWMPYDVPDGVVFCARWSICSSDATNGNNSRSDEWHLTTKLNLREQEPSQNTI